MVGKVKVKLLSHVRLFATPWTVAYQAPWSVEFSRQEYWSGLPCPSPERIFPTQGLNRNNSIYFLRSSSVQFISVAQSSPTLCDPMNCSMPGLPVHHQLLEFMQTHIHRVRDAIQPSHPRSSLSPPAPNPSQHQSFPMS